MKASFDDYSFVAHRCKHYKPDHPTDASKSLIGCLNCKYLEENGHCQLDLYDQIMLDERQE